MAPLRWQLAVPFVGLVVAQRLVEALKGALLTSMPPRCAEHAVLRYWLALRLFQAVDSAGCISIWICLGWPRCLGDAVKGTMSRVLLC